MRMTGWQLKFDNFFLQLDILFSNWFKYIKNEKMRNGRPFKRWHMKL